MPNMPEVHYLGHIIGENGIKIDDKKIKAIEKIITSKNKKEINRFLGMIIYVSKFILNVSQLTVNLRNLTKDNVI